VQTSQIERAISGVVHCERETT